MNNKIQWQQASKLLTELSELMYTVKTRYETDPIERELAQDIFKHAMQDGTVADFYK